MKIEELNVTGMTCASCSVRNERVVAGVEGVKAVSVNPAAEKLHLEYDENALPNGAVRQAVEGAGYGLVDDEPGKLVVIHLAGMTCAWTSS